ncbi:MAG: hypothetical protein R3F11_32725 [Verrucomicrobiales bacterium]
MRAQPPPPPPLSMEESPPPQRPAIRRNRRIGRIVRQPADCATLEKAGPLPAATPPDADGDGEKARHLRRKVGYRSVFADLGYAPPPGCAVPEQVPAEPAAAPRAPGSRGPGAAGLAPDDLVAAVEEWRRLRQMFQAFFAGAGSAEFPAAGPHQPAAAEAPRERLYSPTVERRGVKALKRPHLKPEIRHGKVYFTCPVCQQAASVIKKLAGEETRCPRCLSAIRAPDPRRHISSASREAALETILKPDHYVAVLPRRRRWLGVLIPIPRLTSVLNVGAALSLAAGVGGGIMAALSPQAPSLDAAVLAGASIAEDAAPPPDLGVDTKGAAQRAAETVRQFLAARHWSEKSEFVRDSRRVALLLRDYYGEEGSDPADPPVSIEPGEFGFYKEESAPYPVTMVEVTRQSGAVESYAVEHLPGGEAIEWESSVAYSEHPVDELLADPASGPQPVRVLAALDDYYNFGFDDARGYVCVRLQNPGDGELLGYGYAARDSLPGRMIARHLSGATADQPRRLMVTVKPAPDADQTRQLEIVDLLKTGWREGEAVPLAAFN